MDALAMKRRRKNNVKENFYEKKHNDEIKELNTWSFGGNLITKSNFTLTLYNE